MEARGSDIPQRLPAIPLLLLCAVGHFLALKVRPPAARPANSLPRQPTNGPLPIPSLQLSQRQLSRVRAAVTAADCNAVGGLSGIPRGRTVPVAVHAHGPSICCRGHHVGSPMCSGAAHRRPVPAPRPATKGTHASPSASADLPLRDRFRPAAAAARALPSLRVPPGVRCGYAPAAWRGMEDAGVVDVGALMHTRPVARALPGERCTTARLQPAAGGLVVCGDRGWPARGHWQVHAQSRLTAAAGSIPHPVQPNPEPLSCTHPWFHPHPLPSPTKRLTPPPTCRARWVLHQ